MTNAEKLMVAEKLIAEAWARFEEVLGMPLPREALDLPLPRDSTQGTEMDRLRNRFVALRKGIE